MKTKTIFTIALVSLTSLGGAAYADAVHLGGAGYYGDVFDQSNPGTRAPTAMTGSPTEGTAGKAAFGTATGTNMGAMGTAPTRGVHLGGVDYYGDIYEQSNPGGRTRGRI